MEKYKAFLLSCRNREHGDMEYKGEGNYECSVCGFTYHDDEYDDDNDGERLNVYDAALIWASHGKDEDYMFGYTEKQLEKAFRN